MIHACGASRSSAHAIAPASSARARARVGAWRSPGRRRPGPPWSCADAPPAGPRAGERAVRAPAQADDLDPLLGRAHVEVRLEPHLEAPSRRPRDLDRAVDPRAPGRVAGEALRAAVVDVEDPVGVGVARSVGDLEARQAGPAAAIPPATTRPSAATSIRRPTSSVSRSRRWRFHHRRNSRRGRPPACNGRGRVATEVRARRALTHRVDGVAPQGDRRAGRSGDQPPEPNPASSVPPAVNRAITGSQSVVNPNSHARIPATIAPSGATAIETASSRPARLSVTHPSPPPKPGSRAPLGSSLASRKSPSRLRRGPAQHPRAVSSRRAGPRRQHPRRPCPRRRR